jgi:hypothetical protein
MALSDEFRNYYPLRAENFLDSISHRRENPKWHTDPSMLLLRSDPSMLLLRSGAAS